MTDSVKSVKQAASLHCPNCGAAAGLDSKECTYCHAPLATMSCPGCFNRVFIGAAYCPHCGSHVSRQPGSDTATEPCPRCHTPMTGIQVGTLTLAECGTCKGTWVDADAFDRLCGDREAQAAVIHGNALQHLPTNALEKISYRPCPRCSKMMNRVNFAKYSGVVLDVCRAHGTFFDRDELHRVVTFIQAGGLDRARARDREALEEAERRLRSLQTIAGSGPLTLTTDQGQSGSSAFASFIHLLFHPE